MKAVLLDVILGQPCLDSKIKQGWSMEFLIRWAWWPFGWPAGTWMGGWPAGT